MSAADRKKILKQGASITSLETMLEAACQHMLRTGVLQCAPVAIRDWFGTVRAVKRRKSEPPVNIFKQA